MGCGMEFLKWLSNKGIVPRRGRLLDIGESCLLGATADDIKSVARRHGCQLPSSKLDSLAETFAMRSNLMGHPTIQTLFLSELLELTDVEYVSFEVVVARKAHLFDLNQHELSKDRRGWFDVVFNFGTTEHLMNQYNAFKVMHEAVKPGGHMFHQVPSTGYINHGYFCYNALMFQELAQANGYELVDLWFYGPSSGGNVLVNAATYPGVKDGTKLQNNVAAFEKSDVPNALINVLYRKVHDTPFKVGLEVKTAAGQLTAGAYTSEFIHRGPGSVRVPVPVPAAPVRPSLARRILNKLGRMLRGG
jgi:hypothetical protein